MKIKQSLVYFFFGVMIDDREIAEESGERCPLLSPWKLGFIGVAILVILGTALSQYLPLR